jgi:hypothetical protein
MTRYAVLVACVSVLCPGVTADALADPISLTAGSLVFLTGSPVQGGHISLIGTRGFSLEGIVDSGETRIDPPQQCAPCRPSSTMSVGAFLVGSGFVATDVTLDGQLFSNIGSAASEAFASIELFGEVAVPKLGESPIVLTAPFTIHSSFFQPAGGVNSVPIRGGGVATLTMEPGFGWELSHFRYDFFATPTPEPATLILVGGGLAIALRARRRRESTLASR